MRPFYVIGGNRRAIIPAQIFAICDFGVNSAPIDIATGIFRSRGRPSSRSHMRLICKFGGQLWRRPTILCHSGQQEGDNSGQNRRNLRFRWTFGPYSYRDWYIWFRSRPSFRRHIGLISKSDGLLWRQPTILGHSVGQEGANFGQNRRNLRFRGEIRAL